MKQLACSCQLATIYMVPVHGRALPLTQTLRRQALTSESTKNSSLPHPGPIPFPSPPLFFPRVDSSRVSLKNDMWATAPQHEQTDCCATAHRPFWKRKPGGTGHRENRLSAHAAYLQRQNINLSSAPTQPRPILSSRVTRASFPPAATRAAHRLMPSFNKPSSLRISPPSRVLPT